jgi:hypothetical protein
MSLIQLGPAAEAGSAQCLQEGSHAAMVHLVDSLGSNASRQIFPLGTHDTVE